MISRPQILFYDDMPDFGGHQIMTARGLEACMACPQLGITAALSPRNAKNRERLKGISGLEIIDTPFTSGKLEGIRNRLSGSRVQRLAEWLKACKPHLVVAIQGDIEGSSLALLASRKADIPCISYIPVPHTLATMQAKLGLARDFLNQPYFQLPAEWITISASMEHLLRKRGASQPIHRVENGVDTQRLSRLPDRDAARQRLALPCGVKVCGLMGRVEFKQKQQDFAVKAWPDVVAQLGDTHLVLAGSGPDLPRLQALVSQQQLPQVHVRPWQEDAGDFYAAIDALLIPSRFEGVPLVMLEALACGKPVVATNRDGMKDVLPPHWLFEAGDGRGFRAAIDTALRAPEAETSALRQKIHKDNSLEAFKIRFAEVIQDCTRRLSSFF